MERLKVGDIVRVTHMDHALGYGKIIGQEGRFWVVDMVGNFGSPVICYADSLLSVYRPGCEPCDSHANHHDR